MLLSVMVRSRRVSFAKVSFLAIVMCAGGGTVRCQQTFRVAADGSGDYSTVQAAIDHVSATGGIVLVAPGTYREQVIINQSHVTLRGTGSAPGRSIIVDDPSQGTRGSKPSYATVHVLGDDFRAANITFQNDFNRTHEQVSAGSQAQALNMEGDRNILSNVHILANQDTLYIGAGGCGQAGSLRAHLPVPHHSRRVRSPLHVLLACRLPREVTSRTAWSRGMWISSMAMATPFSRTVRYTVRRTLPVATSRRKGNTLRISRARLCSITAGSRANLASRTFIWVDRGARMLRSST